MTAFAVAAILSAAGSFEVDTIETAKGDIRITFIRHATLMLEFGGKVVHIDPVGQYADYGALPKADLILITHEHGDHFDAKAIAQVSTEKTQIVLTPLCFEKLEKGTAMKNGDRKTVLGFPIEAVPAYNIVRKRPDGSPFHPKGNGNGYVIGCGDVRIYVAGDTENIPEMAGLKDIRIAFLPMNLPYTMTPEDVAAAAKAFKPRILYPYHFGNTDTSKLVDLLKDQKEIEVRIRKMP
ncbi:MAG: MBL fold metallo-hydrolase [Planctomycetes bacterium]|nr:MBL fold metallo-hydrolase [Planctomycetota bacterium]